MSWKRLLMRKKHTDEKEEQQSRKFTQITLVPEIIPEENKNETDKKPSCQSKSNQGKHGSEKGDLTMRDTPSAVGSSTKTKKKYRAQRKRPVVVHSPVARDHIAEKLALSVQMEQLSNHGLI